MKGIDLKMSRPMIARLGSTACTLASLLALAGCAANAINAADRQAEAAAKGKTVRVPVTVPVDRTQARAAMDKGSVTIRGALYYRTTISGREDGWPASPLVQSKPAAKVRVTLLPATPHIAEYHRLVTEQASKMLNWWTGPENSLLNPQPQALMYVPAAAALEQSVETMSDEFGRYSFSNLKPGRYYIEALTLLRGTYNRDVAVGSTTYRDSRGRTGTADHTKLESISYKRHLALRELVEVGITQGTMEVDSRMRVDYYDPDSREH